jgi:hypothetical protein
MIAQHSAKHAPGNLSSAGHWSGRRHRLALAGLGAAGVSGAPGGEKDEACVETGLNKVADQLN